MTLFLYFQLERGAMGPCITDHGFKRPEHHWSKNAERKKSISVGNSCCYRGSSGETGRQGEVRLVWSCFILRTHLVRFARYWCRLVFSWRLQELNVMGKCMKRRCVWSCCCCLLTKPVTFWSISKQNQALWTLQDQKKNVEVGDFFVSITPVGFDVNV